VQGEAPLVDEPGEGPLDGSLGERVGDLLDRDDGRKQRRRRHDPPDPQPRRERLRHGPEVEHPPVGVERLERVEGEPRPAVLGVVVVLDDPRAGAARPFQQRDAPRQRQHGPTGAWCDGVQ
jgi:hypothetical protein